MKFCVKCDNMYYIGISVDDPNQLTYYCRNCKHKDETITEEGVCVLHTQLKKGEQKFNHIINKYTKLDLKYLYICSKCDTTWKTNEQT